MNNPIPCSHRPWSVSALWECPLHVEWFNRRHPLWRGQADRRMWHLAISIPTDSCRRLTSTQTSPRTRAFDRKQCALYSGGAELLCAIPKPGQLSLLFQLSSIWRPPCGPSQKWGQWGHWLWGPDTSSFMADPAASTGTVGPNPAPFVSDTLVAKDCWSPHVQRNGLKEPG